MSYLLCARCDVELFDDPHTDTDLADVCGGCCRVCNPSDGGSVPPPIGTPAEDQAPRPPAQSAAVSPAIQSTQEETPELLTQPGA